VTSTMLPTARNSPAFAPVRLTSGVASITTSVRSMITASSPDETKQGDFLIEELLIDEALGIEATFIYAFAEDAQHPDFDFGLFRADVTPTISGASRRTVPNDDAAAGRSRN